MLSSEDLLRLIQLKDPSKSTVKELITKIIFNMPFATSSRTRALPFMVFHRSCAPHTTVRECFIQIQIGTWKGSKSTKGGLNSDNHVPSGVTIWNIPQLDLQLYLFRGMENY